MNDDFLARHRKQPRPEFTEDLFRRISKPAPVLSRFPALRFAGAALSVIVILTLTVLAFPAARTLAEGVLKKIGGYAFIQGVPQPIDVSKVPGPISIIRTQDSVSIQITGTDVTTAKDLTAADRLTGFSVLAPSYLPSGYTSTSDWYVTGQGQGRVVTKDYHNQAKNILFINQWKAGQGDLKTYTHQQIIDVTVRGRSGVWLPDSSTDNGDRALVWEENGITYSLISDSLPLVEMQKVAESLGR